MAGESEVDSPADRTYGGDRIDDVTTEASSPPRVFGPLPLRSLAGLALIFHQPVGERATTLEAGRWRFSTHLHYAAIEDEGIVDEVSVMLDGELLRWELQSEFGISDRLQMTFTLPFVHTTGGFLDDIIDDFHSATGLERSGSEFRNAFVQRISRGDEVAYAVDENEFTISDLSIQFKYRVFSEDEAPVAVATRVSIELPTGNSQKSLGSGGVDAGIGVLLEKNWEKFSVFLSGDYLFYQRPNQFKAASLQLEDFVFASTASVEWRPRPWWALNVQVDYLSNAVRSTDVGELEQDQLTASLGLSVALSDHSTLRLAFTEDLTGAATADIAFYLGLIWEPGG